GNNRTHNVVRERALGLTLGLSPVGRFSVGYIMAENALYKLNRVADDPEFEGFAFIREESLRNKGQRLASDFGPDDIPTKGRAWTVTRMAPTWVPQPVEGEVKPHNDYPCVNLTIPAFSRRAVDALRDFLEPNGELLPLVSPVGEYYAYNITTVANILDHARSNIVWYHGGAPPSRFGATSASRKSSPGCRSSAWWRSRLTRTSIRCSWTG